MKYGFTFTSANKKTGPIPVVTSSKETCPDACPLKDKECYARFGPLGIHWSKITKGQRGLSFKELLEKIKQIPRNTYFRYGQAGDLPGKNNSINYGEMMELAKAASHTKMWGYTHKPMGKNFKQNIHAIKDANKYVTINLSADSMEEADELMGLKIAPVVVVVKSDAPKTSFTPKGRKVIVCPAQYVENLTCEKCGLCQKKRNVIVGFRAHGTAQKRLNERIKIS